jgi:hypothetical protein
MLNLEQAKILLKKMSIGIKKKNKIERYKQPFKMNKGGGEYSLNVWDAREGETRDCCMTVRF